MGSIEISSRDDSCPVRSPTDTLPSYTSDIERRYDSSYTGTDIETVVTLTEVNLLYASTVSSHLQIALTWVQDSLTSSDIILAALGPLRYHLSFQDAFLYGIAGIAIGSIPAAFVSTFGFRSGHQITVLNRIVVGWWPARAFASLNIATSLGSMTVELILAAQILSALVNFRPFSISAATVVIASLAGIFTILGIEPQKTLSFNILCAQIFVIFAISSVTVSSGVVPSTDRALPFILVREKSTLDRGISFFVLCIARSMFYAPFPTEITSQHVKSIKPVYIFLESLVGLLLSFSLTFVIGTRIGASTIVRASWQDAFDQSPGALIVEIMEPLGLMMRVVCGVALVLGIMSRMVRFIYGICPNVHALASGLQSIPRPIYPIFVTPVCVGLAVFGRSQLVEVMVSTTSITGCWTAIWFAIVLVEHFMFRTYMKLGYDWTARDDRTKLPLGLASFATFVLGCVVVALFMIQTWYIGPAAKIFKTYGLDLTIIIGFAASTITYMIMRYTEVRVMKR